MRKKIDAHVHLLPENLLGEKDERFGVTMSTYGRKILPNGAEALFAPDYLEDSCFSADTLLHVMDNAGVERAVIMQSLCFKMNEDIAKAVQANPERLRGAMDIEPHDESCLDDIAVFAKSGLTVMKFEMSEPFGYTNKNAYPDLKFDSPLMDKVFNLASKLQITIAIDPSPVGSPGYQVEALKKEIKRNPSTKFVICHLGFPHPNIEKNEKEYARWEQMISLASNDNVWFDIAAFPSLYRDERYPYHSGMVCLRKFLDKYGANKVIWGTDIPGTYVDATYSQMIDMYECCGLFNDNELDKIFYENAFTVYYQK